MREFKGRVVAPGTVSAPALVSHGGLNTLASFQKALQFGDKKATCGDQNNPDLYGKQMAGKALYLPQLTEGPGTLWENRELNTSSRCHGFAAHTAVHLIRDVLGLDIPQVFDLDTRTAIPAEEQKGKMQKEAHLCGLRWMRGAVTGAMGIVSREVTLRVRDGVDTGDHSNLQLYLAVALVALALLGLLRRRTRKG